MNDATFRIKPLVWEWTTDGRYLSADTAMGELLVFHHKGWVWSFNDNGYESPCDSIADGKARAEAYYREKLMVALEPA